MSSKVDEQHLAALTQSVLDLATSVVSARAELDALRLICVGLSAVVGTDPVLAPRLCATLQAVLDADAASALNGNVAEDIIEARMECMKRLLPPQLRAGLNLP